MKKAAAKRKQKVLRNPGQLTIRGLPVAVDIVMRKRAKTEGRSLNATLIQSLRESVERDGQRIAKSDIGKFAGTWVRDPACKKALAEMRHVDPEIWK